MLIYRCVKEYLRITRRLDFSRIIRILILHIEKFFLYLVLHRSILYENSDPASRTCDAPYANLSEYNSDVTCCSSVDLSSSQTFSGRERSLSNASSAVTSVRSLYGSRPPSAGQSSMRDSRHTNSYPNRTYYNEETDSEPPTPPPRSSASNKSSMRSQQSRDVKM